MLTNLCRICYRFCMFLPRAHARGEGVTPLWMVGTMCGLGIWVRVGSCFRNMGSNFSQRRTFCPEYGFDCVCCNNSTRNIRQIFKRECQEYGLANLKHSFSPENGSTEQNLCPTYGICIESFSRTWGHLFMGVTPSQMACVPILVHGL